MRLSTALREAGLYRTFASILNNSEDDFGAHAGLYWFASDNHRGQSCPLYAVLSQSDYRPGALERECPEDSLAVYDMLSAAWAKNRK